MFKVVKESTTKYTGIEESTLYLYLNDEEIGYASATLFTDGTAYVEYVMVYVGYRNRGYGTRFLEYLAHIYDGRIYLAPDGVDSRRLYDRIGHVAKDGDVLGYDQGYGVYYIDCRHDENFSNFILEIQEK